MAAIPGREPAFPTRGEPGGWRDPWGGPDDYAALRAQTEERERRLERRTAALVPAWRAETDSERMGRARFAAGMRAAVPPS